MIIKNIGVHHTGPIGKDTYSSSAHITLSQIEAAHKGRDFNLSSMGHYTGYTFVISREGDIIQTRAIGEETCAAKGHNFDTVHIVFIGNFTLKPDGTPVDRMTPEQHLAYVNLVMKLLRKDYRDFVIAPNTVIDLSVSRIFPHRILQPNHTSCYGDFLDDNWGRDVILKRMYGEIEILQKLLYTYQKLLLLISPKKLGSNEKSCEGFI